MFCIVSEEFHVDRATQVHPIPNTIFLGPRAVSLAQNWIAEIKNVQLLRFSWGSKKCFFRNFFVKQFPIASPKRPLAGIKSQKNIFSLTLRVIRKRKVDDRSLPSLDYRHRFSTVWVIWLLHWHSRMKEPPREVYTPQLRRYGIIYAADNTVPPSGRRSSSELNRSSLFSCGPHQTQSLQWFRQEKQVPILWISFVVWLDITLSKTSP